MLLKYKKIGDILSLDDYNAIIYLIKKGYSPCETITLNPDTYNGKFGTYTLIINNEEDVTVRNDGYTFQNNTNNVILRIYDCFPDAEYYLTVNIEKYYPEGIQTATDFYELQNSMRSITYSSENITDNFSEIQIPLQDFLPTTSDDDIGEILKIDAKICLKFPEYYIDKTTGSLEYDIIHDFIEDTESLNSIITNAPTSQKTTIYLKSGVNFDLEDQIEIKNKTIELVSGTVPAVLDANNLCRHFYVHETASLILKNINLINGYDKNETIKGGGSIYVNSVIDSNFEYVQGKLTVNDCNFNNNRSVLAGGAVYSNDSLISITDSVFINNTVKSVNDMLGNGGVIYHNNLAK